MATNDTVFAGSIPELYDRLMVPLIFDVYARDMARRVAALRPRRVLETATGTGAVTRAMTAALPEAALIATDLNQAMLDHAAARHPSRDSVQWRQADALALPFEDASFDVVVCQFGAMFFPDRVKGYAEARRVVKPGGHYLFSVWDRIADNEFADVVTEALARIFPDDPPRFLARTPHGYHDGDRIRTGPHAILKFGYQDELEEQMQAKLYDSATRDPLTQAHNRRYFQERLATEWAYRQVFTSNDQRAATLAPWIEHYNNQRRHSALGGQPPISRLPPT